MRAVLAVFAASTALVAPSAALAAAPADAAPHDPALAELAERMSDPAEQERMAGMVEALGDVLLGLPVGHMANAVTEAAGEEELRADPRATLGQLAGPNSAALPAKLADRVPHMMGMVAGMAEEIDALRPALARMRQTLRESASPR